MKSRENVLEDVDKLSSKSFETIGDSNIHIQFKTVATWTYWWRTKKSEKTEIFSTCDDPFVRI